MKKKECNIWVYSLWFICLNCKLCFNPEDQTENKKSYENNTIHNESKRGWRF